MSLLDMFYVLLVMFWFFCFFVGVLFGRDIMEV